MACLQAIGWKDEAAARRRGPDRERRSRRGTAGFPDGAAGPYQRLAGEFDISVQAFHQRLATLQKSGAVLGRRPPEPEPRPTPVSVPEVQEIDQFGVAVGQLRANLEVLGLLSDSILGFGSEHHNIINRSSNGSDSNLAVARANLNFARANLDYRGRC